MCTGLTAGVNSLLADMKVQNDLKTGCSKGLGDAKAHLSDADHADVDNAHNVLLFIALRRPS